MTLDETNNRKLVELIIRSPLFRDFERSFSEVTGVPVAFVPEESWHLTFRKHRKENPFCAQLASCGRACSACLEAQAKLTAGATQAPHTVTCPAGLCETAVPVRVGERLIGFLRIGQVFQGPPAPKQLQVLKRLAQSWDLPVDEYALRAAYLSTPIFTRKQYNGLVHLITLFANQLAVLSNQLLVGQATLNTPPVIVRARAFIEQHLTDRLSLGLVAAAVNTSPFHFCKIFKRATGLTFTTFVSRLRVEKAKDLLLNPHYRISEIGYAVGFQSLTHFNRKFDQYVGESPSRYRRRIQGRLAAGHKGGSRHGDLPISVLEGTTQPLVNGGAPNGTTGRVVRSGPSMPSSPSAPLVSATPLKIHNQERV